MIMKYFNHNDLPIDAEFIVPIHADLTFSNMEIICDGKTIRGDVKTNIQAKKDYNEAVDNHKTAFLARTIPNLPDLTKMSIGNLPPKKEIIVKCFFHQAVYVEDLSFRLFIPCHMLPRAMYMGDKSKFIQSGSNLKGMNATQSDSKLQKLRAKYWDSAEYAVQYKNDHRWFLEVNLHCPGKITRCVSTTHNLEMVYLDKAETQLHITLDDPCISDKFDQNFVMLWRHESEWFFSLTL